MVVRFITRRFIGEYDPNLEKVYSHAIVINKETILFEILDAAGQSNVIFLVYIFILTASMFTHLFAMKHDTILSYPHTLLFFSSVGFFFMSRKATTKSWNRIYDGRMLLF